MTIIGFFFLLRPGEHCYSSDNPHPFRLCDVSFTVPTLASTAPTVNAATVPLDQLQNASKVHLNFTDQKNGIKDETITHGNNTDLLLSPVRAVARRVAHLRQSAAPADTPLFTVYSANNRIRRIAGKDITKLLKRSCQAIGPTLGLAPKDISARALRAGGAMALLRAGVDPVEARLMGRWRSWAMLEYLHTCAFDSTTFASRMLQGGTFVLEKHATLPSDVQARLDALS